jgi:hypothetical protein
MYIMLPMCDGFVVPGTSALALLFEVRSRKLFARRAHFSLSPTSTRKRRDLLLSNILEHTSLIDRRRPW